MDSNSESICYSTLNFSDDRLSSLSDSILVHILSLLPINVAVSTTVLARRWRHLWTQITGVDFTDFFKAHPTIDHSVFFSIVDDVLSQITSPYLCKFTLFVNERISAYAFVIGEDRGPYWRLCCSQVESLIGEVCGRFVQNMDINLNCRYKPWIPPCVFRSHSLVALSLMSRFDCKLPRRIVLPNLKKLHIVMHYHHDELLRRLFRSCPRLEDLSIKVDFIKEDFVVDISAPGLKWLDLRLPDVHSEVTIDAPNLEVLTISENFLNHRFVKTPTSLREASIIGRFHPVDDIPGHAAQMLKFIEVIASVRSLQLPYDIVDALGYLGDVVFPMFYNLVKLDVFLGHAYDWDVLLYFLQYLPNLEILKVYVDDGIRKQWWRTPNSVPLGLPSHLKTIKLCWSEFNRCNLEVLKHILVKATVLVLLAVRVSHISSNKELTIIEEMQFCEELFRYPRSSPACQIEFYGEHLRLSSP